MTALASYCFLSDENFVYNNVKPAGLETVQGHDNSSILAFPPYQLTDRYCMAVLFLLQSTSPYHQHSYLEPLANTKESTRPFTYSVAKGVCSFKSKQKLNCLLCNINCIGYRFIYANNVSYQRTKENYAVQKNILYKCAFELKPMQECRAKKILNATYFGMKRCKGNFKTIYIIFI